MARGRASSRGRLRPPVGLARAGGGGAVAGIGFTVVAADRRASRSAGEQLRGGEGGRAGCGGRCSASSPGSCSGVARLLPGGAARPRSWPAPPRPSSTSRRRSTASATTSAGPTDAPVTLVEYGDFECPYCGQAEPVIRELLAEFGDDLRYVWRHLPLADVHPRAQLAAEAAEAAAAQGAFWAMYDLLLAHQDELRPTDLVAHAEELGLDTDRFTDELRRHVYAAAHRRGRRRAPTAAASRARRPSSSTACATRAPTTSRRSPPPSGRPANEPRARRAGGHHPGNRSRRCVTSTTTTTSSRWRQTSGCSTRPRMRGFIADVRHRIGHATSPARRLRVDRARVPGAARRPGVAARRLRRERAGVAAWAAASASGCCTGRPTARCPCSASSCRPAR